MHTGQWEVSRQGGAEGGCRRQRAVGWNDGPLSGGLAAPLPHPRSNPPPTSPTCYASRPENSKNQRAAASGGRRRRRPAVGRSAGLSDGCRRAAGVETRLRGPLAGGAGGRGGGRGVGVKRSASVGSAGAPALLPEPGSDD